jgi:ribosome-associated toxin RatA of RatAB toxin-antitoxin module
MTSITNSIRIDAPAKRIYELASATERWPEILPHYRYVRVLAQDGANRTVEMGARRGAIPVRWTAEQRNDPVLPAIYFRHVRGWTRGMDVVWHFAEDNGGTTVSIVHDLAFQFPIAADMVGKYVVCGYFVHGIATRTLRRMKELAERDGRG